MKCPHCKYEYEVDWIKGEKKIIKGDIAFRCMELSNDISISIQNNYDRSKKVDIDICPKCGILFLDPIDLRSHIG